MRIILQSVKSGQFIQSRGLEWTTRAKDALDFGSSARAISFAFEKRLADVEIVLSFDDPRYDVRLPFRLPQRYAEPGDSAPP